jgi:hypothetical protein
MTLLLAGLLLLAVLGVAAGLPAALWTGALLLLSTGLLVSGLRRLGFDGWLVALVVIGVFVYLGYLSYTSLGERNYDGAQQLRYISSIADSGHLPTSGYCNVCHHPPLYYLLAAWWLKLTRGAPWGSRETGLQIFSLLLFLGFLVFSVLTLQRFSNRPWVVRLGAALIVFWPTSIVNSVRVHNDVLAAMLMAGSLLYLVRWEQTERTPDLYWAAALTALGVLTKASGYAMVPVLLAVMAWKFHRRPGQRARPGELGLALLGVLGAIALTLSRNGGTPGSTWCHRLLGTTCNISSEHFIGNKPLNFLYFAPLDFLSEPFLYIGHASPNREYFWNGLLKSSLFGTLPLDPELAYPLNAGLAVPMACLLMAMLSLGLIGLGGVTLVQWRRHAVLLLASGSLLGHLMLFRALIPTPFHQDFRHVFPLLIPASICFAKLVGRYRRERPVLAWVATLVALAFMLLSVLFFAPKRALVRALTDRIIERPLLAHATVRPQGTPTDQPGNWRLERNHVLTFQLAKPTLVGELDVSVDADGQYEIELFGGEETRSIVLGPMHPGTTGLMRYQQLVMPPVPEVGRITLRPLWGKGRYAMGHFIVGRASLPGS